MAPCLQMIICMVTKKESNLPTSQYGPLGLSTVMFTLELPCHQGWGRSPSRGTETLARWSGEQNSGHTGCGLLWRS